MFIIHSEQLELWIATMNDLDWLHDLSAVPSTAELVQLATAAGILLSSCCSKLLAGVGWHAQTRCKCTQPQLERR